MSDRATSMNPRVLRWARERTGLSAIEAAECVGRPVEVINSWEDGSDAPTFRQLETLARAFKRPVAVFFFPDPPTEPDPKADFRTLPRAEFEQFDSDTRLALREGRAWQQSLRELTGGRNPTERNIIRDVQGDLARPAEELAEAVRQYLGVTLEQQQQWAGPTVAFKEWRRVVESVGIYVFKRSFSQRSISGFCLQDEEFPVIVVNNSTAYARQTFTLFHELGHLLFHVSGVTREHGGHVVGLPVAERNIEIACNQFAAEFLVPNATFPWDAFQNAELTSTVASLADTYNVSREVVLRKLLNRGMVNPTVYSQLAERWNREYEAGRGDSSGGNYYATQATYFGDNYLRLAFSQLHAGRVSLPELAEHLGMRARNIRKFEDFLLSRK